MRGWQAGCRARYSPVVTPDTSLIATLAVALALAFGAGLLAARLRLPPLIGYLLAGVVIGPFTPGFVADPGLANELAEIGVILLMFGVGLHFSLADLRAVRRIAVPGAIAQIVVATGLGAALATWWEWSIIAGIVFGLALSVASTVVLLRALEQRGMPESLDGRVAVGWLVVEDLVMVIALVVLPAVAASMDDTDSSLRTFDAADLARNLGTVILKIMVFFVGMYYAGVRLFPWLFARVAQTGSHELMTLFVAGTALGIAYGSAELFGVSFALGAFFAGVVINESKLSSRVAVESAPLQNIFAVLFFVSVGMLFDPNVLITKPLEILGVLAIVLIGKSVAAFLIVLVFGYPARTALTVSASLAQIGEFSFILAALGVTLGLMPRDGLSLVLSAALLSITLNPLMFRLIQPAQRFLERRPALARWLAQQDTAVLAASEPPTVPKLQDHVVMIGYGRVGHAIARSLLQRNVPLLVIERQRDHLERLRRKGIPAIYGDASLEAVINKANIPDARLLVIASPDPYEARRMLQLARRSNPHIRTVVRTHDEDELNLLQREGADFALIAERELAKGMAAYVVSVYEQTGAE
jgi:CPA2 family monovalent cation:H+ antiporter-2